MPLPFALAAAVTAVRLAAPIIIRRVAKPLFLFVKRQIPRMARFLKRQANIAKQWIKRKAELIALFGAKAYARLLNLITMVKTAIRRVVAYVKKLIAMVKAIQKLILGKIKDIKVVRKILDMISVFQKKYAALTALIIGVARIAKRLWQAYGWYDKFEKVREWIKDFFDGEKETKQQIKDCDACLRQQLDGDRQILLAYNTIRVAA
ncbi:MAG: hypothetical protein AAF727_00215 [Pseudomonadota bacterium]